MDSIDDIIHELVGGEESTNTSTNDETKPVNKDENNKQTETTEENNKQTNNETETTKTKQVNESEEAIISPEETNLISNSVNNNDKWSYTRLNRLQQNIIKYVLMNGQLHIPYFYPFDKEELKRKSDEARKTSGDRIAVRASVSLIKLIFLYGFNERSSQIHRLFINSNYTMASNKAYFDPGIMINAILDEGKHLFTNNQYRSLLHSMIYSQRTLTKEDTDNLIHGFIKMNDIDYILSKVRNLPLSYKPKDLEEIEAINNRCQFAPFAAYRILHSNYDFYAKTNDKVSVHKYFPLAVKYKHKIVDIPKDLQLKFNKPHKYFEELTKILKFDKENGFYVYTKDGVDLPVLCLHEYMILSGKPLAEVSINCYLDGACKYCGAEMNAYHEVAKQELPIKVYDLIYKFMGCLNENIDESLMMFAIFDLIYHSVKKNVDSANPTNYDESVVAFAGLYLYCLYLSTKDKVNYSSTKFNKFLDSAKKYWSEIGWTNRSIEQSLNSSIFSDLKESDNAANILKQFIYSNEIQFLDALPLSILFNDTVDPANISKLKAENKVQQLFLTNKMNELNDAIERILLKLWQLMFVKNLVSKYPAVDYKHNITSIKVVKTNNGQKFFKECCANYCPVHGYHEFTNNVCKYCKLNKDKSNADKVYGEYADIINNSFLQMPCVLDSKKLVLQPVYSLSEIEQMKPEDLYEKYIKIDSYVLKQAIDKAINELSNFDEVQQLLKTLLSLNAKDIKKDAKFVKQCLCFIVQNGIRTSESLISELENIYFKIDNIEWLTI